MNPTKDVALVLSSGGPRGFAYIGAIDELESRGYNITSISGCSIGSLVGGVYAAGKLEEFKEWLFSLTNMKMLGLLDFSISKRYLVKGDKVLQSIQQVVPDIDIENLSIPYTAVATDLYTGEEVIFKSGKLFKAIRASISIPSMFRPVKYGHRTLVDGGIVNTMPLDIVKRNGHDLLVGFDVNDVDADGINSFLKMKQKLKADEEMEEHQSIDNLKSIASRNISLIEKVKMAGDESLRLVKLKFGGEEAVPHSNAAVESDDNYYSILSRTFGLMNHTIARQSIELYKPDILAKMSFDAYGAIPDYAKGREIAEKGREIMAKALDEYEERILKKI